VLNIWPLTLLPLVVNDPFQMLLTLQLPNLNTFALTPSLPQLMESFPAFVTWNPFPFGDHHSPSKTLPKSPLLVPLTLPLSPQLLLVANDPFQMLPMLLPPNLNTSALTPSLLPPTEFFPAFAI
jgi:hypothetical protein